MKTLKTSVKEYLKVRRSLGYKLQDTERLLNKFINYLMEQGSNHITASQSLEWAMLPKNIQQAHWSRRLSVVRLFAQYRKAEDPSTEIPASHLLSKQPSRATPYIYSDDEIHRLLTACKSLPSHGLRHHTYFTFFGLIAVTGCRVGELISLNQDDVDLQNGWIIIRSSKFKKSRLLPLHKTVLRKLKIYSQVRNQFEKHDDNAFFVSDKGTRITVSSTRAAFIRASKQIGLRGPFDSFGPRIHDLRHTFAVKSILQWYRKGEDVSQKVAILSAYLGHKKPSDTYWYLSGIPELMNEAAARLEHYIGE